MAVLAREQGRGGRSGAEIVSNASLHLWTVRDGKAASFRVYWDRAEGLEAVGMSPAR